MAHTDNTQMVVKAIQERIARIKSGYEVQSRELDGCDECGEKYWVECQNGFSGRSWDIDPAIEDDIKCFFKKIREKGIRVNGVMYYLDPREKNQLSESNLDIVFVEKSQFEELSKNMRVIKLMMKKYFEFLDQECKEKFKDASLDIQCYRLNLLDEFKKKLSWASCVSRETFIRGIYENITYEEFQRVKKDFKMKMNWNKDEKEAFQM